MLVRRYYYAIVECDCIATALHLYNECDGLEFERSACKFDIRFVPDDQSFEGRQVRSTTTTTTFRCPQGNPPKIMINHACSSSNAGIACSARVQL